MSQVQYGAMRCTLLARSRWTFFPMSDVFPPNVTRHDQPRRAFKRSGCVDATGQAREGRGRRSVDDTPAYAGVAMMVLAKVPSCFDGNISWGSLLAWPGGGVFCALRCGSAETAQI